MKMSRKLSLLLVVAITFLAIASGALLLKSSDQAEAGITLGDSLSCPASGGTGDALVVAPDSAGTSLTTTDTAALSADCYFIGITRFPRGCGNQDLWVLRYLCYNATQGWHYVNYLYCM
ncbi:MAG: hypothetical protein ABSB57_01425 [Dehalococcoidia bacterium]|jgi:hypothetical protein